MPMKPWELRRLAWLVAILVGICGCVSLFAQYANQTDIASRADIRITHPMGYVQAICGTINPITHEWEAKP